MNQPQNILYLTLDVDWATDEALHVTADLLEEAGVRATVFVTHQTEALQRLRDNPDIELGLHPNFRPLFRERGGRENAEDILKRALDLVPEAVSIRTHALVDGSDLQRLYRQYGLTHDATLFIPPEGGTVRPFISSAGLIRVPYFWEDCAHWNFQAMGLAAPGWRPEPYLEHPGLKVFGFHPVSLFLNVHSQAHYRLAHPDLQDPAALQGHRNLDRDRRGAASFLADLIKAAKSGGFQFGLIREITVQGSGA